MKSNSESTIIELDPTPVLLEEATEKRISNSHMARMLLFEKWQCQ